MVTRSASTAITGLLPTDVNLIDDLTDDLNDGLDDHVDAVSELVSGVPVLGLP